MSCQCSDLAEEAQVCDSHGRMIVQCRRQDEDDGKMHGMTKGLKREENSREILLQLIVDDWTRRGRYLRLLLVLGEARLWLPDAGH